jgi:hypothetical protein
MIHGLTTAREPAYIPDKMENRAPGRERMEKSLIKLARLGAPAAPAGRSRNSGSIRTFEPALAPPPPIAAPPPALVVTSEPAAAPAKDPELLSRLARLEAMVAALERQAPATRDLFGEWVRRRQVEEISFAEFLRRKRAGVS